MPALLFIHGTGVRAEAWFRGFDLIARKVAEFLPGIPVHGCQWGDAFGARLHRGGATIPGYLESGDADSSLETAARAIWFLLAEDPLLELRILPKEELIGENPGIEIFTRIPLLAANTAILKLLAECSIAELWPVFIVEVSADAIWKSVVEEITQAPQAVCEKVARALTAAFQQRLRSLSFPNLAGPQRDHLKDAMLQPLGGPPLGIGDWFLERVTNFAKRHRGGISDATTPGVGDIARYQSRGAEIRNYIAHRAQQTGASIILSHSLGGIAALDWLASTEYAQSNRAVQHLITVGSQAPCLYEMDALVSRPYGAGLPDSFPKKWLNIFDRADFLSYLAQPVFPLNARDVEVDNGQPFPDSHSAYWHNDSQVWKSIASFLAEA